MSSDYQKIFYPNSKFQLMIIFCISGTTSPLHNHLSTKHKDQWSKFNEARKAKEKKEKEKAALRAAMIGAEPVQATLKETIQRKKQWDTDDPRHQEMNRLVCDFIIKGYHPFSIVQEVGFVNLMRHAEPSYKIPSRTTFSRSLLPKMYDNLKTKKIEEFKKDQPSLESVFFTTDL